MAARWVRPALGRRSWWSGRRLAAMVLACALTTVAVAGAIMQAVAVSSGFLLAISAFAPYAELGSLVALAVFVAARALFGGAICLLCLTILVATQAGLYVADTAPNGPRLVVLSANLEIGSARAGAVVAAVRAHHVDVLMVQELTRAELDDLVAAGVDDALPYSVRDERPQYAGTGIWSRYPLVDTARHRDFTNSLVTATIGAVPGRPPVHLVALHLAGPFPVAGDWARDIGRLGTLLRAVPSDAPVVVGGDFNATPDTRRFENLLTGGYADAADQAGAGFVPTYPSNDRIPPLITIDHVLTRGGVATSVDTVTIPETDHRALLSTVAFPAS